MNWYRLYRQASPPLPETVPEWTGGAGRIDAIMSQETASREKEKHSYFKYLGHGGSALAYAIPEDKVLKYVFSENDAKLAKSLIGKRGYPIAKVFSVNLVQETPSIWAIIMEKVKPYNEVDNKYQRWFEVKMWLYSKLHPIGLSWDIGIDNVGWNSKGEPVLLDLGSLYL